MFRTPRSFIAWIAVLCIAVLSCQKPYDVIINKGTGTQGGTAIFILQGAPDACYLPILNGSYVAGTAVTAANTIEIAINVRLIGSYSISSGIANGISFSAEGTFTAIGPQTIVLTASGTPVTTGSFSFQPGINGCSFSIDFSATGGNTAVFTLDGSPNACTSPTVSGAYIAGIALDTSDRVSITANVTTAGTYNISTATVNGIKFSGSGTLAIGTQTIVLAGSGTPAATGTNNYTAATNGCSFPVAVIAGTPAVYTLSGAPNACTAAVTNGIYQATVPLNAANTAVINVNVTTPGTYNIITNADNGITFAAKGYFAKAGNNIPVTLAASGTPIAAATSTFTPAEGASSCSFIVVTDSAAATTATYSCKIDGVAYTFTNRAHAQFSDPVVPNLYNLFLDGFTGPANGSTVPEFQIFITNDNNSAIVPGTYNGNQASAFPPNGYRIEIDFPLLNPDQSTTTWNTSTSLLSQNPPFTIVVTAVTPAHVTGTFSGTLTNTLQGSTAQKVITEGVFDLPVQ